MNKWGEIIKLPYLEGVIDQVFTSFGKHNNTRLLLNGRTEFFLLENFSYRLNIGENVKLYIEYLESELKKYAKNENHFIKVNGIAVFEKEGFKFVSYHSDYPLLPDTNW